MKRRPPITRGRLVPLSEFAPPRGGPRELYRLSRLARVREILGRDLGAQLLAVEVSGSRISLVFAGEGWERALEGSLGGLKARLAGLFSCPGLEIAVESRPLARRSDSPPRPRGSKGGDSTMGERLRAVSRKLLARRNSAEEGLY